ncbi:MAG: hypothetical protein KY476_16240 [Planctomycetes bacterium]|nr:hypothetical protein [Planctomycetota bacterium]
MPLRRTILPALIAAIVAGIPAPGRGEDFVESFDGPQPSWQPRYNKSQLRIVEHVRDGEQVARGAAAERIALEAGRPNAPLQLEHSLKAARVLDELVLSVLVRSNRPGATLWLRVRFPNTTDASTGEPLTAFVPGDALEQADRWQELTCRTSTRAMREQLRRARSRLGASAVDESGAYIDQALVTLTADSGRTEILFDDLSFGPVVEPDTAATPASGDAEAELDAAFPVDFRLRRLHVEGEPFFPRIVAHHGEPLEALRDARFNVLWVRDWRDDALLASLREAGLWAMVTPPRAAGEDGEVLSPGDVSILPFTERTRPILLFNLGTRVPPEARGDLLNWIEQIRAADRRYRRPVMVDIAGDQERVVSRRVPMSGFSRHVVGTTFSFRQYRDWLTLKQSLAWPGSFLWTWIQTEPSPSTLSGLDPAPPTVEPEQLRLQVYAALAAGCRGIGFWKTAPLVPETPGARERLLALTQLNLELELLEPWLATGSVGGNVPFSFGQPSGMETAAGTLSLRRASSSSPPSREGGQGAVADDAAQSGVSASGELEAALIRSEEFGTLLLPVWYGEHAQFVPDRLAAGNATIIVHGVPESASAWEVTTTGIRSLNRERVSGGTQVTLQVFDQTAAVVLTSNPAVVERLRQKIAATAEPSARATVELARAKLARVREVDRELEVLGAGQRDAPQLIGKAERYLQMAEMALNRGDFDEARRQSGVSMQALRVLQRAHWETAVRSLTSPVSSPYTTSFQSLPEHWRMLARLGRSSFTAASADENLLRSGDFEDLDTMVVEGWQHTQKELPGIRADRSERERRDKRWSPAGA